MPNEFGIPVDPSSLQGTMSGQDVMGQGEAEMMALFQSLQQQIQNAPPPSQVPVPQTASPLAAAGATFASTLASSILRNPALATQTQARLERDVRAAQTARTFNAQQKSLGDRMQYKEMLGLRIKELDMKSQQLKDAGDLANAIKLQQLKFGLEEKQAKNDEEIDNRAAERDRTIDASLEQFKSGLIAGRDKAKSQLDFGEKVALQEDAQLHAKDMAKEFGAGPDGGALGEKPMTPAQFTTGIRQIQTTFPGEAGGLTVRLFGQRFGKQTLLVGPNRRASTLEWLKSALNTGTPAVKDDAFRTLKAFYKADGMKNDEEIRQAMIDLGVNPAEL